MKLKQIREHGFLAVLHNALWRHHERVLVQHEALEVLQLAERSRKLPDLVETEIEHRKRHKLPERGW